MSFQTHKTFLHLWNTHENVTMKPERFLSLHWKSIAVKIWCFKNCKSNSYEQSGIIHYLYVIHLFIYKHWLVHTHRRTQYSSNVGHLISTKLDVQEQTSLVCHVPGIFYTTKTPNHLCLGKILFQMVTPLDFFYFPWSILGRLICFIPSKRHWLTLTKLCFRVCNYVDNPLH